MTEQAPNDPASAIDLDRFLPYRLTGLAEAVSQALSRVYRARHGLSIPEWRILANLAAGPLNAAAITRVTLMHKTRVSRAASALVEAGLVIRSPSPHDQREAMLALTPRGRAVYADLVPHALGFVERLQDGLDAAERQALERVLTHLEDRARSLAGPADRIADAPE
ncbi:MarR family winged helix-turn-helix transcriptional regulator [Zavarzinia sp. CC-PAN008]|uniref:MarR family winged helix-turn-helix transcriptional regulator n=1 Tax=Zavarzinia sp. CC-PAN008 TaxID=3243332 RepID=UPI003F74348C